ncbi:MAG: alpha/beta hydrolase [Bdellovibrionales bacterium]|nr:alpha/beta hydrolase [Bdellovibrionales bacterium]
MKKKKLLLIYLNLMLVLAGCQSIQKRSSKNTSQSPQIKTNNQIPTATPSDQEEEIPTVTDDEREDEVVIKPKPMPDLPKIGIILGPGGSRVFGEIGVLHELQINKIPIHNVAGIELGALVGGLYAWRNSVNDVEWQMFKIKEDDFFKRSLLTGRKTADISALNPIIRSAFNRVKIEDLNKPFACPALNLRKNQVYIMNRGLMSQLLPYCLPFPPFFKPYRSNISATRDLKVVADYLRSQGANYIIFVNVLGGNPFKAPINDVNSTETLLWAELSSQLSKREPFIDYTITLNLDNYSIVDFSHRREIMQKGSEQTHIMIRALAEKLGL